MAREAKRGARPIRWRLWFAAAGIGVLCVSTAVAALKVREYAITDQKFVLARGPADAVTIQGLHYTPKSKVQRVFSGDFGRSVFRVDLPERRRRLLAIDWVQDAAVSRVWPDRLMVRIRERTPVAFVLLRAGVLLIDSYGVLLDPPPQARFTFPVLSGIGEQQSDEDRREHVRTFLRVQEEMGYLAKDISEIDTSDPDNVRVVVQIDRRALELTLGDGNFGRRYQNFVSHYPEIQKRSPKTRKFDLRLDDRITGKD
jgi:cell division protein FtsQ